MAAGTLLHATSAVAATSALSAAVDDLLKVVATPCHVEGVDDDALRALLQETERLRNRLAVVESALIRSAASRELPEKHGQPRTATWLAQLLRIAPAEASRRVRAAEALTSRTSMTGQVLPATRPTLAGARASGEVSPEHTSIVLSTLETLDRRLGDPEPVARAEEDLTRYATTFDPPGLRRIADHLVEVYDPDGAEPDDEAAERRRFFRMRQRSDTTWTGEFQLTPEVGAQLRTVLRSLSTNRSATLPVGVGQEVGAGAELAGPAPCRGGQHGPVDADRPGEPSDQRVAVHDTRSHGQRTHDALADVCALLLRSGELPAAGGVPATVIVTVREDQLERGTGLARLAGGGTVGVGTLSRLAGQSDVWTVLTSRSGAPLQLGRTRRLASPAQTVALIARDGGCSFPGCSQAPQWCERHHVVEWARGGPTDLSNLTLLCRYHHRHHLERGWRVSINDDGLPEWTPPVWIDPRQRPRVNARIVLTHTCTAVTPPLTGEGEEMSVRSQPAGRLLPGAGRPPEDLPSVVSSDVRAVPQDDGRDGPDLSDHGGAVLAQVTSSWLADGSSTRSTIDDDDWLSWLEHLAQDDTGEDADPELDDAENPFDDEEVVAFLEDYVRRTVA